MKDIVNYEEDCLKSLSISEISKTLLKGLRCNKHYTFIHEIEEKLLEKGLKKELINDLMARKLASLLLKMNDNKLNISKYELMYELNNLVKEFDDFKVIDVNKKIYRLKVSLDGFDDKIYRIYDVTATSYLSNLAYTILGSFNTLAYHLYKFELNGDTYHCDICADMIDEYEINSRRVTLNQLHLQKNDKFIMNYDFGCDWQFNIEVIDILEKDNNIIYPYIVDGKGKGIIEDEGRGTLDEFIKAKDEGRKTLIEISDEEYLDYEFDYTEFDLDVLNQNLHNEIRKIKRGFEQVKE